MKKIMLVLIAFLLNCYEERIDNPVAPPSLSQEHNSVSMQVGDSWLFRRQFINVADSGTFEIPDTLIGYSYFVASKDTAIGGKLFLIIDGTDYEVSKELITTFQKRCAIYLGDTVLMYAFKSSEPGFLSGVMKRKIANVKISTTNFGTALLKQMHSQKMAENSNYDNAFFQDLVYPMIFPLRKDSIYVYRESGDPNGNLPCGRKYLGIEKITIPVGQFSAYKFEYLCAQENFQLSDIVFYDWIGTNGLLKRYIDAGTIDIADAFGNKIGRFRSYDILEFIGRNNIKADTLVPWGRSR